MIHRCTNPHGHTKRKTWNLYQRHCYNQLFSRIALRCQQSTPFDRRRSTQASQVRRTLSTTTTRVHVTTQVVQGVSVGEEGRRMKSLLARLVLCSRRAIHVLKPVWCVTLLSVLYVSDCASSYNSGRWPTWRTVSSIICLFKSSKCFEQLCAHPQEDNCINP